MVSPANNALIGEVLAWTPGTDGPVRAEAVQVAVPERPTDEVLAAHLDGLRGSLTGKIILLGDGTPAPTREMARRHDDEEIAEDRKSTRLNSSHVAISYAVFCLKKKKTTTNTPR